MTNHKITIGFVIDTIATPSAGTEKQLLMLLAGLDRSRFRPVLVCLRPSEWLSKQTFDFPVEIIGLGSLMRPGVIGAVSRFKKLHTKYSFDIIQTFFVDANIFGTIAAHRAGIRTIISSRRNIGYWHTGFHRWLLRRLRKHTTCYLANSKAVIDVAMRTEGVDARHVKVIYNGLDLSRFNMITPEMRLHQRQKWGVAGDEVLVGAVANLRPVKNLSVLVDAVAALSRDFPKLRAVVVGEGDRRQSLQRQIDQAGLTDRFLLPGAHGDILPCLASFDIAVLCSLSESFSNSLVEYMAAGLPTVASDVGGNSEAIVDNHSGLLFDLEHPETLERSLRRLLTNRALAASLGQTARAEAHSKYSRESCLSQHASFYEQLLKSGKAT